MRITIERTRNYPLLWRIATHPAIYRTTSDDFSPAPEMWQIQPQEDFIYLLASAPGMWRIQHRKDFASVDKQILGFSAFYPVNGVTFEAHLCFLSRGLVNQMAFTAMLGWMWENTRAERICGAIPDYNRLAIAFAKRAGCSVYGVNPKSWMKNAILHDQVMLGISRSTL